MILHWNSNFANFMEKVLEVLINYRYSDTYM